MYGSLIEDTKGYVEKKQASTYEELVAEQELKAEEVIKQTAPLISKEGLLGKTG